MSKIKEAKIRQGYTEHPEQKECGNCQNYTSVIVNNTGVFGGSYTTEKNKRCTIGHFSVMKTAICNLWDKQ
jgi:hypothetical protein